MSRINELTRRLLAEGWSPEDTPPGTRQYAEHEGGWTYTAEMIRGMVWETPCGLLADGRHFLNGYMSFHGTDWRTENGNPVITCPKFPAAPCPLRDPLLQSERLSCHSDNSDVIYQCACHRTERPYTYEGSIDEAHDIVQKESKELWEIFKARHKGRVCSYQSCYGRTTKTWKAFYSPMLCPHMCCTYCDILATELDSHRGNVFYDLRRTWTEKGVGLFPDQQKSIIRKGCKLLDKTISLTICEAIVRYGRHEVEDKILTEYHAELFFDKTLKIEIINLRAARVDTRDITQDLQDIANGIEVIHAADALKAAKEQKRARRAAAKAQRIRKVEKMILTYGWEDLDVLWKRRAEKLLDDDRISELIQCHMTGQMEPVQSAMEQISIFAEDMTPAVFETEPYCA